MSTLSITTKLTTITCCTCAITFAVPDEWEARRREDHKGFFCPNGHSLTFTGKTEAENLREQLDAEKARAEFWRKERDRNAQRADAADRRAAAARGQVTKLKNRAAAGVCPCCNRSFVQLERHMSTKHPGFAATQVTPT